MRVAVCEAGPIDALGDAGSRSVLDLIEATRALSHDVLVVDESEVGALEALAAWAPDVVVVSRPGLFARDYSALHALGAPLVYFAHDIHELRMAETGKLGEGDPSVSPDAETAPNAQRARAMRLVEDFCFTHADLTLLPTEEEVREVKARHPLANVERLTWFAIETVPHAALADTVRRAVFIGGERHEPNRDGVQWLLTDIWPQVSSAFDELVIIGDWSAATIAGLRGAAGGVRFTGRLSATEVDDLMRTALVGLSPLRFGAGQKRKTLDYLAHRLPTVATSFGVQGHTNIAGEFAGVRVADTASDWVTALRELADPANAEDWLRLSAAGASFVESEYGPARHRLALQAVYSRWEG
jgi:glycosyltransferase involved in cell wall biosynthesis